MARTLTRRVSLACFFLLGVLSNILAQPNTTPGLPWTVVTPDSLPPGAIDTAFEYSIFRNGVDTSSELRWIYRVNCHIRLTEITESNTFFIEVPRHPEGFGFTETTELIEMANPFLDTFRSTTLISHYISSPNSITHPEYFFPQMDFDEWIYLDSNGDTINTKYFGSMVRMPQRNFIIDNPNDSIYRNYAYFLQYIDSIWFPSISSTKIPKEASTFTTYPNPTAGNFSVELPADVHHNVGGYILRIYDPSAKLLDTRRVYSHAGLHDLKLPQRGLPGTYTITLYDERGRLAVGRIVKLE